MRRIVGILLMMVIILSMTACMNNKQVYPNWGHSNEAAESKGEEKMVLTERQQNILKAENLPTTYEELDESQRLAIVAIEEMFCYLDEKYDVSFEFLGYRPAGPLDKETLVVYPSSGVSADSVSVIRENGVCTDDYETLYNRDGYELLIKSYFKEKFAHVEVFSDIAEVLQPCNSENLRSCISATSAVYLAEDQINDVAQIAKEFGDWYASESEGISCSFAIYVVPEETYWSITRFNRTNYNDQVITRINVTVRADGTVIVR